MRKSYKIVVWSQTDDFIFQLEQQCEPGKVPSVYQPSIRRGHLFHSIVVKSTLDNKYQVMSKLFIT